MVFSTTGKGRTGDGFIQIHRNYVDENFIDLFDIQLVEGRNFSSEYATDSLNSYIINESAVKALGWESAVGKKFDRGQVVGVVKDFHFQPFDFKIGPMWMVYRKDQNWGHVAIKVRTGENGQYIGTYPANLQKHLRRNCPSISALWTKLTVKSMSQKSGLGRHLIFLPC